VTRAMNPVLARELRQRMRGPRASIILTLYLLVLSLIVWTLYAGTSRTQEAAFGGPSAEQVAGLGRSVFQTLLFFVLLLVCFIVPGVSAGAIAGERERQTLVPLQVTMLGPMSIVVGKLLASLAFITLLVVATLPLVGIAFILGGVEPLEVVKGTAMVLVVAAVLASLSVLCSTVTRRTQGATVLAYGLVLVLVVGSFLVFGAQAVFMGSDGAVRNQWVLQANPLMAVADVLDDDADVLSGGSSFSPFTPMQALLRERQNERAFNVFDTTGFPQERVAEVPLLNRVPFVVYSLLVYAAMVLVSLFLAARRVALPRAMP
jgi:ABC-2 type transport system permease protein